MTRASDIGTRIECRFEDLASGQRKGGYLTVRGYYLGRENSDELDGPLSLGDLMALRVVPDLTRESDWVPGWSGF